MSIVPVLPIDTQTDHLHISLIVQLWRERAPRWESFSMIVSALPCLGHSNEYSSRLWSCEWTCAPVWQEGVGII